MALLTIILCMIDYKKWRFARSPFSFAFSQALGLRASQSFGVSTHFVSLFPPSPKKLTGYGGQGDTQHWAMVTFPRTANVLHIYVHRAPYPQVFVAPFPKKASPNIAYLPCFAEASQGK